MISQKNWMIQPILFRRGLANISIILMNYSNRQITAVFFGGWLNV